MLEVELPEAEVTRAMEQAYASLVRRVQVPGFRRGKAPREILERHIGTEALREEALRRLLPESYSEAVAKAGIAPIARPSIEVKDAPEGKGLRFTATVDVYPNVTLPDYRRIRVSPESQPVTDEDVDRALEDVRSRHGRLVSAPGEAARRGDFVLLQITAAPPGLERLQPGKELLVEIGGGALPAALEAALEGSRAGEGRAAQVALPQVTTTAGVGEAAAAGEGAAEAEPSKPEGAGAPGTEAATAAAGPAGEVTVHVADVRRKELPPLDDAFAKAVSDQPTLEALRALLRTRLAQERGEAEARALRERVLDAVLAQTTIDLPESLVQHELEHMLEDLQGRLRSRGLSLDAYLRSTGKDEATVRAELRPGAERRVRARLALEEVAAREALTIPEEEMAAEVEKLAGDLHQDVQKMEAWLAEGDRRAGLRETLLRQKAMTLLVDLVAGTAGGLTDASAAGSSAPTPGESA